ncbi:MAG: GNAT family N-acetyltransferase [Phyllobacteriaceae bacterium]|nr:GNAT family N-acetyltransferase [Phyllobacteriaceae bacterium]
MAATAEIRPVTAGDEAEWRRLWTDYLAFYKTTKPEAVFSATFARILAGNANAAGAEYEPRGLIAAIDGRAVGIVNYLFQRTCWLVELQCYLQDLYADPAVRGTGLGRALIEAVYARADAAGSPSVYWMTQDFNETARRLYDRIGTKTPFIKYTRG